LNKVKKDRLESAEERMQLGNQPEEASIIIVIIINRTTENTVLFPSPDQQPSRLTLLLDHQRTQPQLVQLPLLLPDSSIGQQDDNRRSLLPWSYACSSRGRRGGACDDLV